MSNIDLTFEAASDANLSSKIGYGVKFSAASSRGTRGVVVVVTDCGDRPLGVIVAAEDADGGLVTVRVAGIAPVYVAVGGKSAGTEYGAFSGGLASPGADEWALGVLLPEKGRNPEGATFPEMLIQVRKLPAAA